MKIDFITLSESGRQSKKYEPFPTTPLLWSIIAALTPANIEISLQDEHYQPISLATDSDLVAITVTTPIAPRAYELGRELTKLGKKVVFGGPHITQIRKYMEFMNEPFIHGNAFAIFVGDAEKTWPVFINSLTRGERTRQVYIGRPFDFTYAVIPRRDFQLRSGLQRFLPEIVSIESSRNCPGRCTFCCANGQYTTKPIEQVLTELQTVKAKYYNFIDSNLGGNNNHFLQLLKLMKNQNCGWGGSVFLPALEGKGSLLRESHCGVIYIGIESVDSGSTAEIKKVYSNIESASEVIEELHANGISVVGSFIFGFDHDDISIFERTLEFTIKTKLDDASFHMLMPYPGTPIFDKLRAENRLRYTNFPEDWTRYGRDEVAYLPLKMSPDDLIAGYHNVIKQFYTPSSIYKRLKSRAFSKQGVGVLASNIIKCIKTR